MQPDIRLICRREKIAVETLRQLSGGQVNQVFLVNEQYVIRIGARENAFQRLQRETELLQALADKIPVPRVYAFGQQDEQVYQIQQYLRGQKLYLLWNQLSPRQQEAIAGELILYRKILSSVRFADFGYLYENTRHSPSWKEFLSAQFNGTLAEIEALRLRMAPGFLDLAAQYFADKQDCLAGGIPALVHGDLWLGNILVDQGHITALLDFEYALQAPEDYELLKIEDFCLYPNDYAEEDFETFHTSDFASFCQMLQSHDPDLFRTPLLRERLNLYHLESTLRDHLAWRKANLATIPVDVMAAKNFYMARITNFIFGNGTRMF